MFSGATFRPVSRRARRPLSQSSQLMTSFIGITGTPDLESFGLFIDQFFHLRPVFVSSRFGQPAHFLPVCLNLALQRSRKNLFSTFSGWRVVRRINGNQNALDD